MAQHQPTQPDDVETLLRNARLRDELEPFMDESVTRLNERLPTAVENAYLASMLAWEKAPVLPISQWFEPELRLPPPDSLDDAQLHDLLWETIQKLFDKRIALHHTDHLSDRQLYCIICRDILPSQEKKLEGEDFFLHWECADPERDRETWLKYYATQEERQTLEDEGQWVPPLEAPPYPRQLPGQPI